MRLALSSRRAAPAAARIAVAVASAALAAGPALVPTSVARSDSAAGGRWRVLGIWESVASGDDVRDVAADGDAVWAATYGGGAVRWMPDGSYRQYLAPQNGLDSNDLRAVVRWRDRTWFASSLGLAVFDPARDRLATVDMGRPRPRITALVVDSGDRLWASAAQWWDPEAPSPEAGGTGAWVGGGVAGTSDGQHWEWSGLADGLPSLAVRDLALWRGALWAATEPYWAWRETERDRGEVVPAHWELVGGGAATLGDGRWQAFNRKSTDALSDRVLHLAAGDDSLWLGTAGRGLVAFDGRRWQALVDCGDASRCIRDDYVTALAAGGDGSVWVGTSRFNGRGTGVQVLDDRGTPTDPADDAWHVLGGASEIPGERVNAIVPASDGAVWLGSAHWDARGVSHGAGLARLLPDRRTLEVRLTASSGSGGLADNDVTAIAWHPVTGEMWVGTSHRGVSVRSVDGGWRHYTRASTSGGLGSDDVADIAIEPSGVVWVATRQVSYDAADGTWLDGGLSRYDGRAWSHLPASDLGLPSDQLSALALDGRGRLWVGTGSTEYGHKEHAYRGWGVAVVDVGSRRWERTYTYPSLASDNVTDLVASADALWLSAAYYLYVDGRAGGAVTRLGGGASVFDLGTGAWRSFGARDGLTPAVAPGSSGAAEALVDARTVAVDASGAAWLGGLAYADGDPTSDRAPDGVIDVVGGAATGHHRFPGAGAVTDLAIDAGQHVWAGTRRGGLHVRVSDGWLQQTSADGVPFDEVTRVSLTADEAWLAGANAGLARLRPLAPAGVGPGQPIPPRPPLIAWLAHDIFLPLAARNGDLGSADEPEAPAAP